MSNGTDKSHLWWDETEVIQVLEALPDYNRFGTLATFVTENGGMRLQVSLDVHAPWVGVELYAGASDASVFSVDCWYDCCERKEEKSREFLGFQGARLQSGDESAFGIRVVVQPAIRVRILQ